MIPRMPMIFLSHKPFITCNPSCKHLWLYWHTRNHFLPILSRSSLTMASYPTSSTTTASQEYVRNAKRSRIHDSSEESSATASTTISQTGFTMEKYRAGAPPLQLLPLFSADVPFYSSRGLSKSSTPETVGNQVSFGDFIRRWLRISRCCACAL